MDTGRKFWITLGVELCLFGVIVLCVVTMPAAVAVTVATVGIPSMATLAATFIAGNAAISWQAIKSSTDTTTISDSTTKQITERRDVASGMEPTP